MISAYGDWRSAGLRGAAALAFGAAALLWPGLTLQALVLLFGAYVLVDGAATLVAVLSGDPEAHRHHFAYVVQGVAGTAVGVVTLLWPDVTALALLWLIAAWAILTGVAEVAFAYAFRRALRGEWLLALNGVLSVAFGVVLAMTPGAGALVITWLIGWYGVVSGVVLLLLAWRQRRTEEQLEGRRRAGGRLDVLARTDAAGG